MAASPNRTPRTLAEKEAAVAELASKKLTAIEVAAKHKVSTATLYDWTRLKKEGKLREPSAPGQKPARAERTSYPREFKLAVVTDYQGGDRTAGEVAKDHGVTQSHVYKWAKDLGRSPSTVLAKAVPTALVRAMNQKGETLSFHSPNSDSVEVAMLRARNAKLRKVGRALAELLLEDL